ncbi:MAG: succinate dehydrogenase cytochrome b subunit [Deltaproteobacteria bacterium]|nr:succinate dehydrogenase cytochrome b subunit [Deltaproteobacteria bacterium]
MNWLIRTFSSSIGKKQIMAVTGLGFSSFVLIHLLGNLTIYQGREAFLSYVEKLHSLGGLVTLAELGLVVFALLHIGLGLILFVQNLQARPVRYAVKKRAGGRTIGSITAPYTGFLILVFIIVHLLKFRLVDKAATDDFIILSNTFTQVGYVFFYILGVIVVAVHVSHGFWSGFQTIGLNHPKYMPLVQQLGMLFSVLLGAGFASIPLYLFTTL